MKKYFRIFCLLLAFTFMQVPQMTKASTTGGNKNITILFTHDMHDHLVPFNVEENGSIVQEGGYARLESAIKEEKKNDPNLLLVDGGDFSMGTLFQSIYASDAPELKIMGQMGYDAVTLGNHEFDFRPKGLTDDLNSARAGGDKVPQIVQSNMIFPKDSSGNLTQSLTDLRQSMDNYGVKDYTIIEKNGVKIGIFGLMGKDAASNAPMSEVKFDDIVTSAKKIVNTLKEKEKVDLIVCLSHSGLSEDKSRSEDENLAKKVPEINVIISGHTHTKLSSPIIVGKTIIGSCGEYGENLGVINISQDSNNNWKLDNYKLKPIDSSLPEDAGIAQTVSTFEKTVQQKYLDNFGMKFDDILAASPFNFTSSSKIGVKHGEDTLGNLISDSYIYAVKKAEGANYIPIDVALIPSGTVRGSFVKGNITAADAFAVSSLGIGPDKISGYPLISVYLTGKELRAACEVDASISPIMSTAQLYMSGLSFTFNPNRLIFNKVTKVSIQKPDGTLEKLDDTKLYRVVAGLYSAQMLSVVGDKSYGILSIVPKDKDGNPIKDFESQIIYDSSAGTKHEVKEWLALAEYLQSFNKVDGIPQIPEYYNQTQGRKIVDDNHNVFAIIGSPNGFALAVYGIVILILALIVFGIVMLATRKKRKARRLERKKAKEAQKTAKIE